MDPTGNILRQKRVGPFRLVEKSYRPGTILPKHEHAREFVSFLLTGGYDEISFKDRRACAAGTVIWHPRHEAHADEFYGDGGLLLDLEIDRAWLEAAAQSLTLTPRAQMFCGGLAYSLGLQLYCALGETEPPIEDTATELLTCFFSGALDRKPPDWFHRALEMIDAVDDQPLSLAGLAREAGVHPVHMARSFRRFQGCTFGECVAKVRVRRALELLRISDHTIADVAFACGFADHAHLCRTFKKATGLTPLAYRRRLMGVSRPEISSAQAKNIQAPRVPHQL